MSNIPPDVRKWLEEQKDLSLKDRTKLIDEIDDYFLGRKQRIQRKRESERHGKGDSTKKEI